MFIILAYDSNVIEFLEMAYEDTSFPYSKSAFIALEVTQTTVTKGTQLCCSFIEFKIHFDHHLGYEIKAMNSPPWCK